MRPKHLAWMVAIGWMGASACTPRALPSSFPETAAAAANAQPAEPASVTTALDEDPPLPGEDTRRWNGLHKAATSQGHDHSGHQPNQAGPKSPGSSSHQQQNGPASGAAQNGGRP